MTIERAVKHLERRLERGVEKTAWTSEDELAVKWLVMWWTVLRGGDDPANASRRAVPPEVH